MCGYSRYYNPAPTPEPMTFGQFIAFIGTLIALCVGFYGLSLLPLVMSAIMNPTTLYRFHIFGLTLPLTRNPDSIAPDDSRWQYFEFSALKHVGMVVVMMLACYCIYKSPSLEVAAQVIFGLGLVHWLIIQAFRNKYIRGSSLKFRDAIIQPVQPVQSVPDRLDLRHSSRHRG